MPVRKHPVAMTPQDHTRADSHIPLDRELIERLRAAYAQIRHHDLMFAQVFYESLFKAAPHLRPLFKAGPAEQAAKLTASLDAVVDNLAIPGANADMLAALGRRHAGYGAKPEHYALVIDLLIDAMRHVLGPTTDPRSLDEWRMVLGLVSRQMIAAAQDEPALPTAPRNE